MVLRVAGGPTVSDSNFKPFFLSRIKVILEILRGTRQICFAVRESARPLREVGGETGTRGQP